MRTGMSEKKVREKLQEFLQRGQLRVVRGSQRNIAGGRSLVIWYSLTDTIQPKGEEL